PECAPLPRGGDAVPFATGVSRPLVPVGNPLPRPEAWRPLQNLACGSPEPAAVRPGPRASPNPAAPGAAFGLTDGPVPPPHPPNQWPYRADSAEADSEWKGPPQPPEPGR